MTKEIEYKCVKCGRVSTHPEDPPICDYRFIDGEYWCAPCQWKRMHKQVEEHIKKVSSEIF